MPDQNKQQVPHLRLQRLANALAPIMLAAGLGIDDVVAVFRRAYDDVDEEPIARQGAIDINPDYARCIGGMLSVWRSQVEYVRDDGNCKALPATGARPSLETLYEDWASANPKNSVRLRAESAIELLVRHGVVVEDQFGMYSPTQSWFRINQSESIISGALLDYLTRYAGAIRHSLDNDGQPYFNAHVSRFPRRKLPILNNMINKEGMRTLELFDDFLESENLPAESLEPTVHAGIGMFMFFLDDD